MCVLYAFGKLRGGMSIVNIFLKEEKETWKREQGPPYFLDNIYIENEHFLLFGDWANSSTFAWFLSLTSSASWIAWWLLLSGICDAGHQAQHHTSSQANFIGASDGNQTKPVEMSLYYYWAFSYDLKTTLWVLNKW